MSASLIGRSGSSTFRLSTIAVLMSLAGSRFSSDSAPGPRNQVSVRHSARCGSPIPKDCDLMVAVIELDGQHVLEFPCRWRDGCWIDVQVA